MSDMLFPDNTVLCNFAAVHRLDLLEGLFRERGRWVEAVAYEASQSARHLPDLGGVSSWMGEPIEIDDDDDAGRIERIRRVVFGGSSSEPLKHLGEAQTCYLLQEKPEWKGSWWVSDDTDAVRYAKQQGLITRETIDIVASVIQDGDLTPEAGFDIMQEMFDQDRHLRMPGGPRDLH